MNVITTAKGVCKEDVWKMWLEVFHLSTNFRPFFIANTFPRKGELVCTLFPW